MMKFPFSLIQDDPAILADWLEEHGYPYQSDLDTLRGYMTCDLCEGQGLIDTGRIVGFSRYGRIARPGYTCPQCKGVKIITAYYGVELSTKQIKRIKKFIKGVLNDGSY